MALFTRKALTFMNPMTLRAVGFSEVIDVGIVRCHLFRFSRHFVYVSMTSNASAFGWLRRFRSRPVARFALHPLLQMLL